MDYTISGFWASKFKGISKPQSALTQPGWNPPGPPNRFFIEAELNLRGDQANLSAPVWFVAAPGAVGKSTLAKAIASQTGTVYLDLATAASVAGNYLSGGLTKNACTMRGSPTRRLS